MQVWRKSIDIDWHRHTFGALTLLSESCKLKLIHLDDIDPICMVIGALSNFDPGYISEPVGGI